MNDPMAATTFNELECDYHCALLLSILCLLVILQTWGDTLHPVVTALGGPQGNCMQGQGGCQVRKRLDQECYREKKSTHIDKTSTKSISPLHLFSLRSFQNTFPEIADSVDESLGQGLLNECPVHSDWGLPGPCLPES